MSNHKGEWVTMITLAIVVVLCLGLVLGVLAIVGGSLVLAGWSFLGVGGGVSLALWR